MKKHLLNFCRATLFSSTLISFHAATAQTPGAALKFDGSNDRVHVPNSASLNFGTGDFSVEAK